MLQIVHDVAPGAALAFTTAFTGEAGFANGINALVTDIQNTSGGNGVIVDDILYFSEPMFQDGVIGQAADNSVLAGIPYYSSIGNDAKDSYESPFVDSGLGGVFGGVLHDFDPGPGVSVLQEITVPVNGSFTMSFQWNQPFFSVSGAPGAATDLDILIVGADGASLLAGGTNFNTGGDALEVFSFANTGFDLDGVPGFDTKFFVLIENFAGPDPSLIKYVYAGSATIIDFDTDSASGYGHPGSLLSVGVGAAPYFNTPAFGVSPPLLESFSSRGGIPTYFDTAGVLIDPPDYRPKPEIVAPDGVNTTFFGNDIEADGFPNFFGTSASAPSAAGVAALLLSIDTSRTPAEVNAGLRDSAVDMLAPGYDVDSGSGLIDAAVANVEMANEAPDLDPIPSQRGTTGQTLVFDLDTTTNPVSDGEGVTFDTDLAPGFCSAPVNDGDGTGSISCTIGANDFGRFGVIARATDTGPLARTDIEGFYIFANENTPPTLNPIAPQAVNENQQITINFSSSDPESQPLLLSSVGLPAFCSPVVDNGNGSGSVTCNPGYTDAGDNDFRIVTEDNGVPVMADSQAVDFQVNDVNRIPVLTPISDQVMDEGDQLVIPLNATDEDTDNLPSYVTGGLPGFCTLNDNGDYTGDITCNPGPNDAGVSNVTVTINDNAPVNGSDNDSFQLTVNSANVPPTLAPIGQQSVEVGQQLVIPLSATDPEGDTLTFSDSGLPGFCVPTDNGNGTGDITCNPTMSAEAGTYPVTVTVTDDGTPNEQDSENFDIVVSNPTTEYADQVSFLAAAGNTPPGLIDFEGYAPPNDFVFLGNPGNFSEQGVTFTNNSQMFIQNNDLYGTGAFLSPQGADPHIVTITLPAGTRGVGFSYQSAAATIQINGGEVLNMAAVPGGTLGFFGVVAGYDIQTLVITVSGPGIDIDNFYFYALPVFKIIDQDTDGDGKSDILFRNLVTGQNQLYIMDGLGISQNLSISSVAAAWQVIGRGDYDGDGNSDILWRFAPTGAVWIYFMDGNTILSSAFVATVSDPNWQVVGNGDYNGDGKSDILWRLMTTGTVWLYEMDGNTIVNGTGIGVVPDLNWRIVGSGDYNGDGKSDILWRNIATGTNWMYLMNGTVITTNTGISVTPDLNWEIVGNGDFDGDGKCDILWRNSSSGTNWLYLMNGTMISSSDSISVLPDQNWIIVGDGDYSGDKKADVLWRNLATGSNYMYIMDGFNISDAGTVSVVTDQNWQIVNPR